MAINFDDPRVEKIHDEIMERVTGKGLMSCTFSGRMRGFQPAHQRVSLRPVLMREIPCLQMVCRDGAQSETTNIQAGDEGQATRDLLRAGYAEIHLMTAEGDLHVKFSKKGRMMASRSKPLQREVQSARPHDRKKQRPLDHAGADGFLHVAGLLDPSGDIKPSMQAKFRQINEFLRTLEASVGAGAGPLRIVDCGCGRALLLFSAYYFCRNVLDRDVFLTGVDNNARVLSTCRKWSEMLDLDDWMTFCESSIAEFSPSHVPDVVLSLHACDTATDEALAGAVRWGAKRILSAPCCQHDLQKQLKPEGAMRGLLRHGILRERFADLLTDTFRAQLLRIAGYRVKVMEFVEPEATARNVMLRAERMVRPGRADALDEYAELKAHWQVVPELERLMGATVSRYIGSSDDDA